jgi:hypothetical protein
MLVDLKNTNYYFLTYNNPTRKEHIIEEFKEYNITEVNPDNYSSRHQSTISGFQKMLEIACKQQDKNKPFQPFVLFEDDVKKYREFPNTMEIPDNTDVLYIGLSQCGIHANTGWSYEVYYDNVDKDFIRIYNMLTVHGIMICSLNGLLYLQKCLTHSFIIDQTCDVNITFNQPYYNVYALRKPLVYQYGKIGGQEIPTKIEYNNLENPPPNK